MLIFRVIGIIQFDLKNFDENSEIDKETNERGTNSKNKLYFIGKHSFEIFQ